MERDDTHGFSVEAILTFRCSMKFLVRRRMLCFVRVTPDVENVPVSSTKRGAKDNRGAVFPTFNSEDTVLVPPAPSQAQVP